MKNLFWRDVDMLNDAGVRQCRKIDANTCEDMGEGVYGFVNTKEEGATTEVRVSE